MVDTGWTLVSVWWIGTIPMSPMGPAKSCIILTCYFEKEKKKIIQILKSSFVSKDQEKITPVADWSLRFLSPLKHCSVLCSPLHCLDVSLQDRALWIPWVCLILHQPPSHLRSENQCVCCVSPGKQLIPLFRPTKRKAENSVSPFFKQW